MSIIQPRILVFAPVHNREIFLPHYLKHLLTQTYPKHLMSMYFIVNNSTDNTYKILKQFKEENSSHYENIKIEIFNYPNKSKITNNKPDDRSSEHRFKYIYSWLSLLRNKGMEECVKGNYDYIFSCDSDILLCKQAIQRLLDNKKDYCAGLIYNGYLHRPDSEPMSYNMIANAYRFPNIMKKETETHYVHISNYKVKNPHKMDKGTLIEVDYTGAVFLASQDVCKVMKYAHHKIGEDLPASLSAINAGYTLYCDVSLFNVHCMSKDILDMYLDGKLTFNDGTIIKLN